MALVVGRLLVFAAAGFRRISLFVMGRIRGILSMMPLLLICRLRR